MTEQTNDQRRDRRAREQIRDHMWEGPLYISLVCQRGWSAIAQKASLYLVRLSMAAKTKGVLEMAKIVTK